MSEDTQITINKDSKTFILKTVTFCFAGLLTLGVGVCGYTKYQDYRTEQAEAKKQRAHKEAQAIIKAMITLCDFNRVSPEEQATIDKCGDDVEAAHRAISNIVDNRVVYWGNMLDNIKERVNKILNIKRGAMYWSPENEQQFQEIGKQLLDENDKALRQQKIWQTVREKLRSFDTSHVPDTETTNNINNT